MNEDPREQQRQQRRTPQEGTAPEPYRAAEPPARPVVCRTTLTSPARVFYQPQGCPVPSAPDSLLPPALVFGNGEITRNCSDIPGGGPIGDSVTVAADTFTENIYFQALPDITTAQLTFIAKRPTAVLDLVADPTTSANEVRVQLQLDAHQATTFVAVRTATIAQVQDQAISQALGLLNCFWVNVEKSANCGAGALETDEATDDVAALVFNPSTVAAGEVSSFISQNDADEQALTLAQSRLRCLWANVEQRADCVTDLGLAEAVPNDVTPVSLSGALRVGSVVVPAGSVFSDVGQEDADAQAKALAVGNLACFYVNQPLVVTCSPDVDNVPATVTPTISGIDVTVGRLGNPVNVPAGFITSEVDTRNANEMAEAAARLALDCFWTNDAQTATCKPTGPEGKYLPSPTSPVITVTVAAGEVISYVSKADANAQALIQAELQLDCRYCNLVVPPRCAPLDFNVTTLPIPLSEVDDSWSLDATLGAPAGLFCAPEWESAQAAASSIANIPIPPADPPGDCVYGNDPIEAQCIGSPTDGVVVLPVIVNPRARGGPCVGGQTGTVTSSYILPYNLPADGVVRVALFDNERGTRLSSQSYPNPFAENVEARKVSVAKNAFTVSSGLIPPNYAVGNPNRAKLYANELAATLAIASLNCFFSNCAGYYLCHGAINAGTYNPPLTGTLLDTPVYGTGTATTTAGFPADFPVATEAYGSNARPVYVQEGQFVSYTSYDEVALALNAFLRGTLDCYWTNRSYRILCGARLDTGADNTSFSFNAGNGYVNGDPVDGRSVGSLSDPVIINAELFNSYQHPRLADLQAIQLGLAQLDCFFLNRLAQANCRSTDDGNNGVSSSFAAGAITSSNVSPRTYMSKFSQANADNLAKTAALAALSCLYTNGQVQQPQKQCASDEVPTGPTQLGGGVVTSSVGTANANETAKQWLLSMQSCQKFPTQPGNDGAQTNCNGNCYGYYS